MYRGKYYFESDSFKLIYNDIFKAIKKFEDKSIDMIFADPPYFLSGNGITCSGGKMVSVNKGEWDKTLSIKEKHKFNKKWIRECYRILKDNGTIWISGTLHNIYSIGMALEEEGFKIINNITYGAVGKDGGHFDKQSIKSRLSIAKEIKRFVKT